MASVATKLMTAEQFYEFANRPENRDRHLELEDGEVVAYPLPGELEGVVCGNVVYLLRSYVRAVKRGFVCSNSMGIVLKKGPRATVYAPDISLFRDYDRFEQHETKYLKTVPAMIVEVLATNYSIGRLLQRVERILASGVQVAWLVDPEARNLSLFRKDQAPIVLEEKQDIANLPEIPGFRCRVAELFAVNE